MKTIEFNIPEGFEIDTKNSTNTKIVYKQKETLINNLIIDTEDLNGLYTWNEALNQIKLLNSLHYKGFNTWRLPTKDELNTIYQNKNLLGVFSSNYYCSSTEYDNFKAWSQYFDGGYQTYTNKSYSNRVRCVKNK